MKQGLGQGVSMRGKASFQDYGSPFLTVKNVAKILRYHEMTIYRMVKEGKIKHFRTGDGKYATYRFRQEDVDKLLRGEKPCLK